MILRHAKADRPTGVADVDRPLTGRGHADAAAAGAWLASRGYPPDVVLCSPAKRTRQTWHGVALALSGAPDVRYEPDLYAGGVDAVLSLIASVPGSAGTVLVVGHNPTVSMLSARLDPATAHDSDGLRTSGIAVHARDGDWASWTEDGAALVATATARA